MSNRPDKPANSLAPTLAGRVAPGTDDGLIFDFLAPAQAPDELGRLGPYRVLKVLGRGGMGVVFQGEDPHLRRSVALKVMLPAIAARTTAKERFQRKAQATAALEHDNVVTIYGVGEERGVPYFAMPLLKGMSLDDYLRQGRKLSVGQMLRLGREIARGLAAAHARNLIHRDIKPANIWLDANSGGRVKILDFGLARMSAQDTQLTQEGTIVGTPSYMSPEQARSQDLDARSDLFSLGCVLYRLATGRIPFVGQDVMATLMALATDEPPPVNEGNPHIPPALADLIKQLLRKKPEERPQSAKAVAEAIGVIERDLAAQRAAADAPIVPELVGDEPDFILAEIADTPVRKPRWRRWLWIGMGIFVALVVLDWLGKR